MTHCPSCGRYAGPYAACPHCGAALGGRTSIRVIQVAALTTAVIGLGLLWLLARASDVPTVAIGQVNALMNMAYVRVEGRVTRVPTYDPASDYLGFWLSDGTGELFIASYADETRTLVNRRGTPGLGDHLRVEGSVRVREDFVSLTLRGAQHLQVFQDDPEERQISTITATDALLCVRVRAQVRAVRNPYPGLTLLSLRDASGQIDLAIPEYLNAMGSAPPAIDAGQTVVVTAVVSLYKETPQLSLAHGTGLAMLDEPLALAPEVTADQVNTLLLDSWVKVRGRITAVLPFSAGTKYTLEGDSGGLSVLVWDSLYDELEAPETLAPGATVEVSGWVDTYGGELEIVPELPIDIQVVAVAPERTAAEGHGESDRPAQRTIRELTGADGGENVTVRGTVLDCSSFSHGFRFTIDDGTGRLLLLAWLDLYDKLPKREGLRRGARVEVTGTVEQFEEQWQIVPASPAEVLVLAPGLEQAEERPIASLTGADQGTWISVEGEILRTEAFNGGLRAYLYDGSGTLVLLVWQSILDRISQREALFAGSRVRVQGKLEEHEGRLEMVPALPCDVAVTPQPRPNPSPAAVGEIPLPPPERTPADTPEPLVRALPLGALDQAWIGEQVTVTGEVVETASFSQGFKFTLDDGSGQIVLLMWHDVYDNCAHAPQLNAGAQVQATGKLGQFEGVLQLEPGAGAHVMALSSGGSPPPAQPIGVLGDYQDQRVTISGQIRQADETGSGLRLVVSDDTGQVPVFIWDNVLARIPGGEVLRRAGATVRVTGMVQMYRGELEVVPALPYDVEVLP